MGMNSFIGGAAIFSVLMIALTFAFFGAMCFAADDIRRLLQKIADAKSAASDAPPTDGG